MTTLHLLIGPVGSGKSTFARAQDGVFLDLDTWMVRLYGDDPRPPTDVLAWYLARRSRVRELMWSLATDLLSHDTDVYLELGLTAHDERLIWYERAGELDLVVHVLDAPREVRRERVAHRNTSGEPHVQVVPPAFFEAASDAWEPPTPEEFARWPLVSES